MTKGAEKLGLEKDEFMKKFQKASENIRKIVENQYDTLFKILCEKADSDPAFDALVCQDHKSWSRCYKFVESKAREMAANGNMAMVEDAIVFGWIDEYYLLDDKAEVEEEKRRRAELEAKRKADIQKKKEKEEKKAAKAAAKAAQLSLLIPEDSEEKKTVESVAVSKTSVTADKEPKQKKTAGKKEVDGQMNLFDLF